jgi:hypothetical protein
MALPSPSTAAGWQGKKSPPAKHSHPFRHAAGVSLRGRFWHNSCLYEEDTCIGISLGHVLMYHVLDHLGAIIEGGAEMVTLFLTFIGAALLCGERWSAHQWAGGLGVIAGSALMISAHRPNHSGDRLLNSRTFDRLPASQADNSGVE